MRVLARLVAVPGLVLAGGLALPGGAAQAAACSNSTGVTVVVDYGSTSSSYCAADAASAGAVLDSVTDLTYVPMYGKSVVCKINGIPSNQTCQRMPPASAYWAFFHAQRGGSWTYSSSGVASYDPAPGSVIGFAFGSGGAPSSPPPGAATSTPSPKPSPSSSSSRPPAPKPAPKPSPKPAATTPARSSSSSSPRATPTAGTSSAAGSPVTKLGTTPSTTTPGSTTTTSAAGGTTGTAPSADATGDGASAAADRADSTGSSTTLLAGLGLVGLVGAGAAYLAIRRRATS